MVVAVWCGIELFRLAKLVEIDHWGLVFSLKYQSLAFLLSFMLASVVMVLHPINIRTQKLPTLRIWK